MLNKDLLLDIKDGDLCLSTNDPLVFEKECIYVGQFDQRKPDGTLELSFKVDEATIDHWIETHDKLLAAGLDVPMPEGHTESASARKATCLSLSKKPDGKGRIGLFAKLKFKDLQCAQTFKDSQVSIFSPKVTYHGQHAFVRPIRHICFTDYPVVADLDPLTTIAASAESPKGSDIMLKALAKALGIDVAADATDEQVSAAIQKAFKEAGKKPDAKDTKSGDAKPDVKIAASTTGTGTGADVVDPLMITLASDNRAMKIDSFVGKKLTPAAAAELKKNWTGANISCSTESNNAFSSLVSTFESLPDLVAFSGERSGPQKFDSSTSGLVASAKKHNEANKR